MKHVSLCYKQSKCNPERNVNCPSWVIRSRKDDGMSNHLLSICPHVRHYASVLPTCFYCGRLYRNKIHHFKCTAQWHYVCSYCCAPSPLPSPERSSSHTKILYQETVTPHSLVFSATTITLSVCIHLTSLETS